MMYCSELEVHNLVSPISNSVELFKSRTPGIGSVYDNFGKS